jgi:hypothetical protein
MRPAGRPRAVKVTANWMARAGGRPSDVALAIHLPTGRAHRRRQTDLGAFAPPWLLGQLAPTPPRAGDWRARPGRQSRCADSGSAVP